MHDYVDLALLGHQQTAANVFMKAFVVFPWFYNICIYVSNERYYFKQ